MNEAKIKALENKMFKLLKNKPYNVVRAECDRIGRQLRELDNKFVKTKTTDKAE